MWGGASTRRSAYPARDCRRTETPLTFFAKACFLPAVAGCNPPVSKIMKVNTNIVLQRFRENKPILLWVPTPVSHEWFIEMAAINGYHGIWIDYQHQNYSDNQIAHMCLACRAGGIEPIVRVRKRDAGSYSRAFEMGGTGIIVPHVNTAAEARAIVQECKFPPMGNRGLDGVDPPAKFGYVPGLDYVKQANQETCIIIQIEEREAVENVEEIATVPGIEELKIGRE